MDKKDRLRLMLSKLRQQRHYLEKSCERAGKLLPVSVILRWRKKGTRDFQPIKKEGKEVEQEEGKIYSYMTYLEGGVTRHRYIRKDELDKVLPKAKGYQRFSRDMAKIRYLNRKIVGMLEHIGKIQMEEVKRNDKEKRKKAGRGTKESKTKRKTKDKKKKQ